MAEIDPAYLKEWEENNSPITRNVIAVRAALRTLPFLAAACRTDHGNIDNRFLLPSLRAFFTSQAHVGSETLARSEQTTKAANAGRKAEIWASSPTAGTASSAARLLSKEQQSETCLSVVSNVSDAAHEFASRDDLHPTGTAESVTIGSDSAWNGVSFDIKNLEQSMRNKVHHREAAIRLLDAPLWSVKMGRPFEDAWEILGEYLSNSDGIWDFWRDWYQGVLDGKPLDWRLQRRIAQISDEDWQKGPEHIATRIQNVRRQFETERAVDRGQTSGIGSEEEKVIRAVVLQQIAALKDDLPKHVSRGAIGHNQPPEEFELHGDELEEVLESLEVIESELVFEAPDAAIVVEKTSNLKKAIEWIAGKLDTTVDGFCKSFGGTLGTATAIGVSAAVFRPPYWGKLVALLGSLKDWLFAAFGM